MSVNHSDIAILKIKGFDYHCIISEISKNETLKLNGKCWFDQKKQNIIQHEKFIFICKNGQRLRLAILKLKKINLTVIRLLFFWEM